MSPGMPWLVPLKGHIVVVGGRWLPLEVGGARQGPTWTCTRVTLSQGKLYALVYAGVRCGVHFDPCRGASAAGCKPRATLGLTALMDNCTCPLLHLATHTILGLDNAGSRPAMLTASIL